MRRSLLFLVIGFLLGAVGTAYFFGVWHSRRSPGIPLRPPDQNTAGSSTVAVTIDEKFFDSLLGTIFQQLGPPQLKLAQNFGRTPIQPIAFQNSCNSVLALKPESGNVKTGVRFTGGKITAPLAFSGSYSILTNCIQFSGTARATVDLSFDQEQQTVFGRLTVDEVLLDHVTPLVSGLVTAFVRKTIDEKLNPFPVLRVSQFALSLPIQASGGSLKAHVKDVRAEIQEGSLKLYLTYEFSAERASAG